MAVIEQIAPQFTQEDAVDLARTVYGLSVSAKPLPSYIDQNFLLQEASGQRFVLRIANAGEDPAVLDLQQQALSYLAAHHPDPAFQQVLPTLSGATSTVAEGREGTSYSVWLVTYLEGRMLVDVKPQTPALLHSLGQFMGQLDRVLEGFTHPAMHRDLIWDLKNAARTLPHLAHIDDPAQRALVEQFMARFEREVLPVLPRLRQSVIQNDGNDYNALVSGVGEAARISGLLDFGDMLLTHTVCEPAIAAAYAMLGNANPLAAAAQVIGGYHTAYPLTEDEIAVLYGLIGARLCSSVLMSAYRKTLEPDNDYLMVSAQPVWAALAALAEVHPRFAHYTFRQACGLEPCPQTRQVVDWLRKPAVAFAPVVEPDMREAHPLVFDLSVGSLLIPTPTALAEPSTFTGTLFGEMKAAGATVGVGRYDEARLVYTTPQFRSDSNEIAEHRTIHMGIDLFQYPGAHRVKRQPYGP